MNSSDRLLMALKSLDHHPLYTTAVRKLDGGGSVSVLYIKDFVYVKAISVGEPLVGVAAVLALSSASTLPGRGVGPGRALKGDLRC